MVMRCALMYGFETVLSATDRRPSGGGRAEDSKIFNGSDHDGRSRNKYIRGRGRGVETKFEVAEDALCNVELNSCY